MNIKPVQYFRQKFGEPQVIVRSPGRVNIIGEHTDYNEGFVLPAAIDRSVFVVVNKRDDDQVHLLAADFHEDYVTGLNSISPVKNSWANYILGIVDQLKQAGAAVGGFNLAVSGEVPVGAGLSSSAAVECAVVFGLNELFSLNLDKMAMVKMAQRAEHQFAGVRCGIMDMFASMFGRKGHAMKLDCRSLDYSYVPLDMQDVKIVLLNTNVKHNLASSEYNTRRSECEQGVRWVQARYPQVQSLRDVNMEMLDQCVRDKDAVVYRRCKYVLSENGRLLAACGDLERGDLAAMGKKMFQSHQGLSEDYGVSCAELDFLVNGVRGEYGVLGARMMGGGFGGCTINLVKADVVDKLIEEASRRYKSVLGLELTAHVAQTDDGTGLLL